MRLCLVSPYAWDRPSEANDHWGTLAQALARRGHDVVVLAPARRPGLLLEGRRRLRALEQGDGTALQPPAGEPLVVAVGAALPIATGGAARNLPLPVATRASMRLALGRGAFDVVDALDPDVIGASAVALRESPAPTVATFFRAGLPMRTPKGAERLAARADAFAATSRAAAETALRRFGIASAVTGIAIDGGRFQAAPAASPPFVVIEVSLIAAGALRALFSELADTPAEIVLLRSAGAAALRPLIPTALAGRIRTPDAATPAARAAALRGASAFVAAANGSPLVAREAAASGVPIIAAEGSAAASDIGHDHDGLIAQAGQPALVAALVGRVLADPALRNRLGTSAAARGADETPDAVAARLEAIYATLRERPPRATPDRSSRRILCDFHIHTEHSHDCATPVDELVERAVALGLGAIAVTDHNTIAGGLAAQRYALERGHDLHVIVGSEIKTTSGEVIGLYLTEEIPRGMPFADTVEAIRAQGAVVYVPHPFDRLHAIADTALLRRLVDQIDVFETFNARLYREAFNREAERFAERYTLLRGAGSDAHVLEGLGSGAVELPRFDDPASLLVALASGTIVRRPANLLYLQGLKWIRQARRRPPHGESVS